MNFRISDKDEVLQRLDVGQRLRFILNRLEREVARARVMEDVKRQTEIKIEQHQREFYLRQQLRAIQAELGEADPGEKEAVELLKKIDEAKLPGARRPGGAARDGAAAPALAGVERVSGHPHLPRLDPRAAVEQALGRRGDRAQEGRGGARRPALRPRARRRSASSSSSPCASCAAAIRTDRSSASSGRRARARPRSARRSPTSIGREFYRISVGGVRDEAEIRGHRRTYVGAMPGLLIQALRRVQVKDPVLMIDEIDKMSRRRAVGRSDGGDARGARSEPERRVRRSLPQSAVRPVRRAVHLHGEQPVRHPCPAARPHGGHPDRRLHGGGEGRDRVALPAAATARGARHHATRTSSSPTSRCRSSRTATRARRDFATSSATSRRSCASARAAKAEGEEGAWVIDVDKVEEILGIPRYAVEEAEMVPEIGVVTGLAWTATGGDLMVIEALRMPGSGRLTVTGQLGDVMRESVDAAYSLRALARGADRHPRRDVQGVRPPRAPARGRDPEGRAERRHHAHARDRERAVTAPGAARRRDDRRGDAARQGARDRRREGEGARRVSRRPASADHAEGEREGSARRAGRSEEAGDLHLRRARWTRCCDSRCCRPPRATRRRRTTRASAAATPRARRSSRWRRSPARRCRPCLARRTVDRRRRAHE